MRRTRGSSDHQEIIRFDAVYLEWRKGIHPHSATFISGDHKNVPLVPQWNYLNVYKNGTRSEGDSASQSCMSWKRQAINIICTCENSLDAVQMKSSRSLQMYSCRIIKCSFIVNYLLGALRLIPCIVEWSMEHERRAIVSS